MSVINNNLLLTAPAASSTTGVSRSLRFSSGDSSYLSRTPASAGNQKTWTWAGWVKRSALGANQALFGIAAGGGTSEPFGFNSSDKLWFVQGAANYRISTSVYRDTSAWYHIVLALDTTQATANNRIKIYVNGAQVDAFDFSSDPSQNVDLPWNNAALHTTGSDYDGSVSRFHFSGYLADIYFIDGQALDPTSFTETHATTGQLIPKAYTGSYGTNGFHLEFADNSAATATTLGKDSAGSNNWTPNNFSVTAGAGNDSLVDVPTNGSQTDTGVGGEVRGNYATLNPLDNGGITLTNGNLDWSRTSAGTRVCYSTIGVSSGKWYFESSIVGATGGVNWECGVATVRTSNAIRPGTTATAWQVQTSGSTTIAKQNNNTTTTIFTGTILSGDIFSVALDMDNGRIWFGRNGTWLEGSPSAGTGASFTNLSGTVEAFAGGDGAVSGSINFGQRPFAYTAPSGFKALCTTNLPAPLVTKPSTVMDVSLWTGNGGTQSITLPGGFSPDFVWVKARSNAQDHYLFDVIRGGAGILRSNTTGAESTGTSYLSFDSAGFSSLNGLSSSGYTYAGWCWDAGTSTVTNTQGSITSQVRANASAGFSIVTYTGTGANATIGHGLGVAPSLILVKTRSINYNWAVYHIATGNTQFLYLDQTAAASVNSTAWNNTSPTSSVFSVGSGTLMNAVSQTHVAYCFAPVAGYSVMGSYSGSGSSSGSFIYTGHRPRWVMIKRTDTTGSWYMFDSARNSYNTANGILYANTSDAEGIGTTSEYIDFLSNGFKLRGGPYAGLDASGGTYIYMALAESPFNYARAR